jgi:pilus assembly protein CpaE
VLGLSKKLVPENNEAAGIVPSEWLCNSRKTAFAQELDKGGANLLSIGLVSPDDRRRSLAARALDGLLVGMIREYCQYPTSEDLRSMMEMNFDAVIVELDSNPAEALELVERICGNVLITVMVFTANTNVSQMIKCMRAGAREFLTEPFVDDSWVEALERTSVRRPVGRPVTKTIGKLHVFFGAKGGAGVTTIASNFAVLLGRESGKNALLIDLDLPLGDAALTLGVSSQYSTVDALQNVRRLDSTFLANLLRSYSPTLSVLGAPGKFTNVEVSNEAVDKLMTVARREFEHVVVDSGSRLDLVNTTLFEEAVTIYLVTRVSIPELRNANRLVSEFFA